MNQRYQNRLAAYSLWIDILLLNLSFATISRSFNQQQSVGELDLILQLTLNLSWLLLTYLLRTYEISRLEFTVNELLSRFVRAVLLLLLVMTGLLYFTEYRVGVSRFALGGCLLSMGLTGCIARILILKWLRDYRRSGHNKSGYLTVGSCELGRVLQSRYEERRDLGLQFRGAFEFSPTQLDRELERLELMIEETKPDYLYCCMITLSPEQIQGVIQLGERQRAQIRLVPDFRGFLPHQATMQYHDVVPVIEVSTKPYSNVRDETYKRAFDLTFSVVIMVFGAPVFGLVALLVKLLSPGPIFFKQERTGRWGQRFNIYKFRTMRTDADKMGLQHSQGDQDPRITPIGKVLRKTRLDELPQFLNVLRGEMSIVGPRPLPYYDVDMLMEADPIHFKKLLTVKPGITSIGQIKVGYADSLSMNLKRMAHDLDYLRKYSLWYDLYLIGLTVQLMVLRRGK